MTVRPADDAATSLARLCGGTLAKPEGDEPRAIYDAVTLAQ